MGLNSVIMFSNENLSKYSEVQGNVFSVLKNTESPDN